LFGLLIEKDRLLSLRENMASFAGVEGGGGDVSLATAIGLAVD